MSDKDVSRRDFIKGTVAAIGGLIGTVITLPTIAYLLSPAMTEQEDTDSIDLAPLEIYPIGIPTRFEMTRTRVRGMWLVVRRHDLWMNMLPESRMETCL